jgi:hypothetical protein
MDFVHCLLVMYFEQLFMTWYASKTKLIYLYVCFLVYDIELTCLKVHLSSHKIEPICSRFIFKNSEIEPICL